MKKTIILFLLICATVSAQNKTLTLEESLEIGLKNSKEIKISESVVRIAKAYTKETEASFFPSLALTGNYTRLSDVDPFQVNLPTAPFPIKIQDAILNNYTLKAGFEQPLFTGFALSSLNKAAEIKQSASEISLDLEKKRKAMRIIEAFWNYYKTDQLTALVEASLESLTKHKENTIRLSENGLVTQDAILKIDVEIANKELALIDAENNNRLAGNAFNKELGLPLSDKREISVNAFAEKVKATDFNEMLAEAYVTREELKVNNKMIDANKELVTVASANYYPQIMAHGNFYYNKPNQRVLPLEDKFNETWDVGVTLRWNIWDWGKTSAGKEKAEEQLYQSKKNVELLKENIHLEVLKNYNNYISSVKKIDVTKRGEKSAEENYRIVKEKYYQQLMTATDLLDAEVAKLNAKTQNIIALADSEIAKYNLFRAIGRKLY